MRSLKSVLLLSLWIVVSFTGLTLAQETGGADTKATEVRTVGPPLSPAPEGSFSIVVIPDSQAYRPSGKGPKPAVPTETTNVPFDTETRWIVDNVKKQQIVFVTHVGDIVNVKLPDQWALARRLMDRLHGVVPYGIAPGNHDMRLTDGDTSLFQQCFPATRFTGMPWYGGAIGGTPGQPFTGNNADSFQLFSAAGLDFVILHLECNAPDNVLQWADGVLNAQANRRAIVSTHMWLGPIQRPKILADGSKGPHGRMQWKKNMGEHSNTAEEMWQKSLSKHDNLFAVFCGDESYSQAMYQVSLNEHGKPVHEMLSDYSRAGAWCLRVCRFLPAQNRVEVWTVDSRNGSLCEGTQLFPDKTRHEFSFDYDMSPKKQ